MANISGPQPDVLYCPACKSELNNVPRSDIRSTGHTRANGMVAEETHTYACTNKDCERRFEINQAR